MVSRKVAKSKIRYCKKCKIGRLITNSKGMIFCSLCGAEYKQVGNRLKLISSNY